MDPAHSCHSTVPIQIESSPQSVDSSDDWDDDMCDGGHQFLEQLRQVHESVHIRADDRDAGKVEYEDLCDSKLSGWLAAGLPLVLLQLVARLRWAVLGLPRLHCVEYFCGVAAVARGMRIFGLRSVNYDNFHNAVWEDLTSMPGFCLAITLALRLAEGCGLLWFAPVCATWIFMARPHTKRCAAYFRGDERRLDLTTCIPITL